MNTRGVQRALLIVVVVILAAGFGPGYAGMARALPVPAQTNQAEGTIPYSGVLSDPAGQPVADGLYDLSCALYATETGGDPLWSEEQPGVQVWDGDLALRLGRLTPIPDAVLGAAGLWLSVSVRGPGEAHYTLLTPRQRVSTVTSSVASAPTAGGACPHDHFGEEWESGGSSYGLMVENTDANTQAISGIAWSGASAIGVRGWSYDGAGVKGIGISNKGVEGYSQAGQGVYGSSVNGIGILGKSDTGPGVRGEASVAGQAGVYGWNGSSGPGIVGYSSSGIAISAVGTGKIYSSADSVLYLSPFDMVSRDEGVVSITRLDNGGVRVRNLVGSGSRYLSIPVSEFGVLLGSTVYVKSLEVCYKVPAAFTFISSTGVYKNNGSDTSWVNYLQDVTSRASTTYTCYTVNASIPRKAIDNSTWVQFNTTYGGGGDGWDIYIYTAKLTITENQN